MWLVGSMVGVRLAPVTRVQARALRALLGVAEHGANTPGGVYPTVESAKFERAVSVQTALLRLDRDRYAKFISAIEVGLRALEEYDARPFWRKWTRPPRARSGDIELGEWAAHLAAICVVRHATADGSG